MSAIAKEQPERVLSGRRIGVAGVAAVLGCAACCAVPLLAAAGVGSGAVAVLSVVFRPGSGILVGSLIFVVVLGVMAMRRGTAGGGACKSACSIDRDCCGPSEVA